MQLQKRRLQKPRRQQLPMGIMGTMDMTMVPMQLPRPRLPMQPGERPGERPDEQPDDSW